METKLHKLELTRVGKEARVGFELDGFNKVSGKPIVIFQHNE